MKGDPPPVAGREADQRLFDQVLTSISQNDVIANSGLELYRRVNDCARDYMEAKQIVERREHEIAAISSKIEAMQATAEEASKHLRKAQELAAEVIDNSVSEQFRLRERDNLINILIGMTNAIAKGDCHDWSREKVDKYLEDLQAVYQKNKYYCQSSMVDSGIVHVAKHFAFHADFDDAFEPMLFHLANQADYKGFVERARREDREFAKQHHVDYSARPSAAPKTKTSAANLNEGPAGKAQGSDYGDDTAPHEAPGGAGGAAQANLDGRNQDPLQKLTPLPPRSSSLPASARKTHANIPGQPDTQQAPADAALPGSCRNAVYKCNHLDLETSDDLAKLAEEFYSKRGPQRRTTSGAMSTAVLESIAGVEAIFKNRMDRDSPELKKEVASVSLPAAKLLPKAVLRGSPRSLQVTETCYGQAMKFVEELNKAHVMSDQVDRKLGAVAERHGCAHKTAKQGGPETNTTHGDEAFHHEEGVRGSGEGSDLLWKAHVSSIASSKR
ncbi:hypothetical protein SLS64_014181 [Diaporthe eres]|uniref:Uncharacterized protein n=1 Tax=Diaporthe eres TaxID=83184 RepID=A0ABR1NTZ8_DIAER